MVVAAAWSESAAVLGRYANDNGHDWGVFGKGPPGMAEQYQVFSQATKVGIAADGVIVIEGGSGGGGAAYWRDFFEQIRG